MALQGSVARRYAKALLGIASGKNQIQGIGAELISVVSLFDRHPDLHIQLLSPALTTSEREKFLNTMIQGLGIGQDTANFLLLVNRKGRLEYLKRIRDEYQKFSDDAAGLVRAQIFSAHALPGDTQGRLISALEKRTSKKVEAKFEIVPGLIGGIKVQIGGLLLDGSISAQLVRMKEELERI